MPVTIPPPRVPPCPSADIDAGVIEEARRRQRRRRRRAAATALVVLLAGGAYIAGGGSGGVRSGGRDTSGGSWSSGSVGNGINVTYPRGWHLFAPPVTSLVYPYDRMLLTSYPAATGGDCSPTRAENALPSNGVLIYLFEYSAASGSPVGRPPGSAFPPESAAFKLRSSNFGHYDCWTVPSYLMRFSAAGRLFQVQLALGAGATPSRRAEALRALRSLRARALGRQGDERPSPH